MYVVDTAHSFQDWPDDSPTFGSLVLYFAGCDFGCSGCHNIRLKAHSDEQMSAAEIMDIIEAKGKAMPAGRYTHVILSGGDPLSSLNGPDVIELAEKLSWGYNVMIYTGQEAGYVQQLPLRGVTYVKCGKYNKNKTQPPGHRGGCFFLASTNQVLLDGSLQPVSRDGVYTYK